MGILNLSKFEPGEIGNSPCPKRTTTVHLQPSTYGQERKFGAEIAPP